MKARAAAAAARRSRPRPAPPVLAEWPSPWIDAIGWGAIASFALILGWVAFRLHGVGDYSTESDFYGGYAEGARLFQRGRIEFSRWPVVGPGYELALALVGFATGELFTAARVISVASAIAVMLLWWRILRKHSGSGSALWAILFLGANPVFFRYSFSASTDLLAMALQAATLHVALLAKHRWAPLASGLLAAFATLTRYNYVFLVPAALTAYLVLRPEEARRRSAALHLAGFALVVLPWFGASLAAGHLPGRQLFDQFGSFYTVDDATRNVQDQSQATAESLAAVRAADRGPGRAPSIVKRTLANLPDHLRRDAVELMGWPATALVVAGLAAAILDGSWRGLLPLGVSGALLFATLLPVFYSDRYAMALLPAYFSLLGIAATGRWLRSRIGALAPYAMGLLALAALALTIQVCLREQRRILGNQPLEVVEAGRALGRASVPGDLVLTRKGHVAYYGGRNAVTFPRVPSIVELGEHARKTGARFLYYSWYEANVRPELAYLLDTTAVIPGLTRIYASPLRAGVLYRIGPEFGTPPGWYANVMTRSLHLARAYVQFLADSLAVQSHVVLGNEALERGDLASAEEHVARATAGGPLTPGGWRLTGHVMRLTGRPGAAIHAYERALTMRPGDLESRLGLGWAHLGTGNAERAAEAWGPTIGAEVDSTTLLEMVRLFDSLGDRTAAGAARAELRKLASPPVRR